VWFVNNTENYKTGFSNESSFTDLIKNPCGMYAILGLHGAGAKWVYIYLNEVI